MEARRSNTRGLDEAADNPLSFAYAVVTGFLRVMHPVYLSED